MSALDTLAAPAGDLLSRIAPAALLAGVLVLSVHVGVQSRRLAELNRDIIDQDQQIRRSAAALAPAPGPPLVLAPAPGVAAATVGVLQRQAAAAGLQYVEVKITGQRPILPNRLLLSALLTGTADAPSLERFARWVGRGQAGVVLKRLVLTAPPQPSRSAGLATELTVLAAIDQPPPRPSTADGA